MRASGRIFEQYSDSSNQVSRFRDSVLPAASESLELTRQMYQAGEMNYLGLRLPSEPTLRRIEAT